MENIFNSNFLTAIATVLLVLVGFVQIYILFSQKEQTRIALTEQYRQLWESLKLHWGNIIFVSRNEDEYYQILDENSINSIKKKINNFKREYPTIWALESVQKICGVLSEVSTRVLQGHLNIEDIYPIFGTQFLRQTRPLRELLEPKYKTIYTINDSSAERRFIKEEIQDWLIYHDGTRRRCLILIDLLWAEAVRLEDLPPDDMQSAADAKKRTGKFNKKRIIKETIKLNGILGYYKAFKLSRFLKNSEYFSFKNWHGIKKSRLDKLHKEWNRRLLR